MGSDWLAAELPAKQKPVWKSLLNDKNLNMEIS